MISSPTKSGDPPSEDLERLILRLDAQPAIAWERYATLRHHLTKIFQWKSCFPAEDLADEALDRVGKRLKTERIDDVTGYSVGVARMLCLEAGRKKGRENSLNDLVGGTSGVPDPRNLESQIIETIDGQMWLEYLQSCLAKLKPMDRVFILAYYSADTEKNKDHRRKLSERYGLSPGALRTHANRLRDRLESCVLQGIQKHATAGLGQEHGREG
jgi:DNA-directed RNA polymerase specialized sigma24 family protein